MPLTKTSYEAALDNINSVIKRCEIMRHVAFLYFKKSILEFEDFF